MTYFHAVVWMDHEEARVLQLRAEDFDPIHVKAHHHNTAQHASGVRTQHEFFGAVCDAVAAVTEVLIMGSRTTLADFRHYVDKHRPAVAKQIVGWETSEPITEGQAAAFARAYFGKVDRLAGFSAASRNSA